MALVADGLTSMNGVAETYRQVLPHIGNNVEVTTLACGNPSGIDAVEISRAATLRVPLYPDLALPRPHLSELAERIFDVNADVIHVTGPGPLGLAGLAMAKVLRLPLVASYHTELADYAFALTQDPLLSELMHTGISRFYGAADLVLAPSHTAAQSVARLLGVTTAEVQQDRYGALRALSEQFHGCWVVLKGRHTLIGGAEDDVFVNSSGDSGLAQGGSGDLLAGYITGWLAQPALQQNPALVLRHAVFAHGAAADRLSARRENWIVEELAGELGKNP